MEKWFWEILNSPYKDWIMWSALLIIAAIGAIFKWVRQVKQRHKKKTLPWVGKIDGIDKD